MNWKNNSVSNEPSMIVHSIMPPKVIAGNIEYLLLEISAAMLMNGYIENKPLSSCKILLAARAKPLKGPCPIPQVCPSIARAFVYKNQLFWNIMHSNVEAVLGAKSFVAFTSMFRYLVAASCQYGTSGCK